MRKLFKNLVDQIFPNYCVLCQDRAYQSLALCDACCAELPWNEFACCYCGETLEPIKDSFNPNETLVCGNCIAQPPIFNQTRALFRYDPPISQWITRLKFHRQLIFARLMGQLFVRNILQSQTPLPELIIPVPLHSKRLRERGFNQALEIARPISKALKIPLDYQSVVRIKHTDPQSSLPAKIREKNLSQAFALKKSIQAKHIAIIDDVMTTGHTITELCKILKKSDIENITIWCCARASIHKKQT